MNISYCNWRQLAVIAVYRRQLLSLLLIDVVTVIIVHRRQLLALLLKNIAVRRRQLLALLFADVSWLSLVFIDVSY